MPTVGQSLILSVLKERRQDCLYKIDLASLNPEFETPLYLFVRGYLDKYGELPDDSLVTERFNIEAVSGSADFWMDQFVLRKFRQTYDNGVNEANRLVIADQTDEAQGRLIRLASELAEVKVTDDTLLDRSSLMTNQVSLLPEREKRDGIMGVPTPWPALTRMTRGWIPGNVYVVAARKKVGKTQCLLLCSELAYDLGEDVLVISMEMTQEEYGSRTLSYKTGVGLDYILDGGVSLFAELAIRRRIEEEDSRTNKYFFKEGFFKTSLEEIERVIMLARPTILFIDGAYLIRLSGYAYGKMAGWERVTEVMKFLKLLSGRYNIPLVVTYQFNKEGEVHLSDAIAQIATAVIGLYEDPERGRNYRTVRVLDNRNGPTGEFVSHWDLKKVSFNQIEDAPENYLTGEVL